jgi:hypothetical protein
LCNWKVQFLAKFVLLPQLVGRYQKHRPRMRRLPCGHLPN